jgi:hypothetical protein
MAFSRRLSVIGMVGASWLLAIACEGDDIHDDTQPVAGEAGEAPIAGKSSAAGSKNNGGKAGGGDAGEGGGTSGAAGGGNGGTTSDAGNGGTTSGAGQAGSGETAGAGGGESPGGAGGATGGQGGAGGEGGASTAVAASCSFSCINDDACIINQNIDTFKCNPVSHRCEDPTTACAVDADCLPSQSFWSVPCVDDDACDPDFEACVDANGKGFCASLPDPDPDFPCFFGVPRTLSRFGTPGTVEVCAGADPRCMGGACAPGCGDALGACGQGNGDTCSAATGLCECTQGTECTKTGVCGGDGHCQQCKIDEDCAATVATTGYGICVAGKCGCANPTTCVNPGYATAMAACE